MLKLTDITLNEMLTHKNEIIRRNAMSTLKQLQREQVACINRDSNNNACYDCEGGNGYRCGSTENK